MQPLRRHKPMSTENWLWVALVKVAVGMINHHCVGSSLVALDYTKTEVIRAIRIFEENKAPHYERKDNKTGQCSYLKFNCENHE